MPASPHVDDDGALSPQPPVKLCDTPLRNSFTHIKLRIPLHLPYCRPPSKGAGETKMQLPHQEAQPSLQHQRLACKCQLVAAPAATALAEMAGGQRIAGISRRKAAQEAAQKEQTM